MITYHVAHIMFRQCSDSYPQTIWLQSCTLSKAWLHDALILINYCKCESDLKEVEIFYASVIHRQFAYQAPLETSNCLKKVNQLCWKFFQFVHGDAACIILWYFSTVSCNVWRFQRPSAWCKKGLTWWVPWRVEGCQQPWGCLAIKSAKHTGIFT